MIRKVLDVFNHINKPNIKNLITIGAEKNVWVIRLSMV